MSRDERRGRETKGEEGKRRGRGSAEQNDSKIARTIELELFTKPNSSPRPRKPPERPGQPPCRVVVVSAKFRGPSSKKVRNFKDPLNLISENFRKYVFRKCQFRSRFLPGAASFPPA